MNILKIKGFFSKSKCVNCDSGITYIVNSLSRASWDINFVLNINLLSINFEHQFLHTSIVFYAHLRKKEVYLNSLTVPLHVILDFVLH